MMDQTDAAVPHPLHPVPLQPQPPQLESFFRTDVLLSRCPYLRHIASPENSSLSLSCVALTAHVSPPHNGFFLFVRKSETMNGLLMRYYQLRVEQTSGYALPLNQCQYTSLKPNAYLHTYALLYIHAYNNLNTLNTCLIYVLGFEIFIAHMQRVLVTQCAVHGSR